MKKMNLLIVWVLLLVSIFFNTAWASFEISWYDAGWYDPLTPKDIPHIDGKAVLLYTGGPSATSTTERWEDYLEAAEANNTEVIISIKETVKGNLLYFMDMEETIEFFMDLPTYSNLRGWYIADEPVNNATVTQCENAYYAIKTTAGSTKPVYICIANLDGAIYNYRNSYDVLMYDDYPCRNTLSEFGHFNNYYQNGVLTDGWKAKVLDAIGQADAVSKPIHIVIQSFGQDYGTSGWRLPTQDEYRFMIYFALHEGADGISFWANHHTERGYAQSSEAFPYDGLTWKNTVAAPAMSELDMVAKALDNGVLQTGSLDNVSGVYSKMYKDPDTGFYYLMTLNYTNSTKIGNITIQNVSETFVEAAPLGVNDGTPRSIVMNGFVNVWAPFEVKNYRLKIYE